MVLADVNRKAVKASSLR